MQPGPGARGGITWVVLASVALSTAPVTAKAALSDGNDPTTLITFRIVVGAAALWLLALLVQPRWLRVDLRTWGWCAAAGAANAASMLCYYIGLRDIDASLATLVFSAFPAAVLLLLWLAGERVTMLSVVRLLLALTGVALLSGSGGTAGVGGTLLILIAVWTFALHVNLVQWRLHGVPPIQVAIHVVGAMALCLLAYWGVTQGAAPQWPNAFGWGVVVWTGLVATAFARFAIFTGIARIGSGQTALLLPVETLCILLWSLLFLGERLELQAVAGGVLVLTSALLAVRVRRAVGAAAAQRSR